MAKVTLDLEALPVAGAIGWQKILDALNAINDNTTGVFKDEAIAFTDTTASTSTTTGAIKTAGGLGVAKDIYATNVSATTALKVNNVKVVGAGVAGFVTSAGTAVKDASTINADTITATDGNIQALAKVVKALLDALLAHGLIKA